MLRTALCRCLLWVPLLGVLAGCATTDGSSAGTLAEQLRTFAGDFLRQILAAFLT